MCTHTRPIKQICALFLTKVTNWTPGGDEGQSEQQQAAAGISLADLTRVKVARDPEGPVFPPCLRLIIATVSLLSAPVSCSQLVSAVQKVTVQVDPPEEPDEVFIFSESAGVELN